MSQLTDEGKEVSKDNKIIYPFIPIPRAALLDDRIDRGGLAVLLALYSLWIAKQNVFSKNGNNTLRSRCSKRYARNQIKALIKFGYIRILREGVVSTLHFTISRTENLKILLK